VLIGSGVVPLMAMIRYRKASGEPVPVALLLSSRTWGDVLFRDELLELERSLPDFALALALIREPATRRVDFSKRIDASMVADVAARLHVSAAPSCAGQTPSSTPRQTRRSLWDCKRCSASLRGLFRAE
jgi:ferredoxin-NADP reductase